MIEKKQITCIECPRGCTIDILYKGDIIDDITGFTCKRGKEYAENEFRCPRRILTTTVKTDSDVMVPVKTLKPIKKSEIFDAMKIINKTVCKLPVECGEVIVDNIIEGIPLVATKTIK